MEWQEETLCNYECKYNLMSYYGTQVVASIHKKDDIWYSVIDGIEEDLSSGTLEEAKYLITLKVKLAITKTLQKCLTDWNRRGIAMIDKKEDIKYVKQIEAENNKLKQKLNEAYKKIDKLQECDSRISIEKLAKTLYPANDGFR